MVVTSMPGFSASRRGSVSSYISGTHVTVDEPSAPSEADFSQY
jgi:hypothetical protein